MSKRSVTYTDDEDKLLCNIYSDFTQRGNNQTGENFWNRIVAAFNEQNMQDKAPAVPHPRTVKSLESRFSVIQAQCKLFLGCIKAAEDMNKSGASQMDIVSINT